MGRARLLTRGDQVKRGVIMCRRCRQSDRFRRVDGHSMAEVCTKCLRAQSVWVQTVSGKQRGTLPKQIKVVNEINTEGTASRLEPVVECQQTAESYVAMAESWDRAREKHGLSTIKEHF